MKLNHFLCALCLVGWLLLAGHASTAHAATLTVCASGCDHTTIADAITAASNGDTITILDAVHTEQGIVVDKSLIIQGQGAANTAVQAAANRASATDRVFYIANTAVVTFQDLTIRHGNTVSVNFSSGGGIYNLDGTVTINDSSIFDNTTHNGGGIHNASAGTVTINNSTILDNDTALVSTKRGGGIDNRGMMTINYSTISGNTASNYFGGGVYNNGGTIEINNSVISNNQTADGGGLYNTGGGNMTVNNSTISGNTALFANGFSLGGGGVYNNTSSTMTINNSTISGNTAQIIGGGIRNRGTLTINNSTLVGNSASNNTTGTGGILQTAGTLNLNRTIVSGNSAPVNSEVYGEGGTINANNFNVLGHNGLDNAQAFSGFAPGVNDRTATSDGSHPTALASILNPALAANGGSTLTHALVTGSPAIDIAPNGSAGTTDQRGAVRDFDADTGDGNTTHLNDAGAVEFREKITEGDCGLEAIAVENTFTFASGNTVTINVIDPAELTCISVEEMGTNHPMATGSAGNHGIHTGNWWHISGDVDSGFEVEITLPFAGADDDSRVCKWPGENGGAGWDCGDETVNSGGGGVVTRIEVDSFSDWAVGDTVNPTAVSNLQADVTPAAGQGWLVGLLVGLLGATTAVFLRLRHP